MEENLNNNIKKEEKIELIKKAFELKNKKNYSEALDYLYQALEYENDKNDNIELLSQIGNLHYIMLNYDKALEEFHKVLAKNPHHNFSILTCYEIYIKTKQYQKALKFAQNMLESEKTSRNFYYYINVLVKLNKKQDAIEVFNSLDEEVKLDVDLLYLIATIMPDKKELLLEKIIQMDNSNVKANLELAKIAYENKQYDKVIQHCLNVEDDNPLALYYLALIEQTRKNHTRAIELLLSAIDLNNKECAKDKTCYEYDFYFDLAKAYIDICWFDEALAALKKSINLSINKKDLSSLDEKYYLTGWVLIKQNKLSNALLNLNSIKKDSKIYQNAQILTQIINLKNFDLARAKSKLEELYENEKDNLILLDTLALTYKELKLYKKAIEIYQKALELYPDSIYYMLEIIDLLIDIKDYTSALDKINSFTKVSQNCPSIYNSLARIYYRLENFDEALNAINKYIELDNNKAEAHYFKGLILNDLKRYDEAIKSLYSAINLNPNIAKYYNQMAKSYLGLKEYNNAILYAKEAIELDQGEINYKKLAYEISILIGDKRQIELFKTQLERSEKLFRLNR